jgi:hypothetical protein
VRVRKESNTSSDVVITLNSRAEVETLGKENNWFKIKYGTYEGYIREDLLGKKGTVVASPSPSVTTSNSPAASITPSATTTASTTPAASQTETPTSTASTAESPSPTPEITPNENEKYLGEHTIKIATDVYAVPVISTNTIGSNLAVGTKINVIEVVGNWARISNGWIRLYYIAL